MLRSTLGGLFGKTGMARSLASASSPMLSSPFAHVELAPPDPILGVAEAYRKDTFEGKINVSVGAYRDEDGKPVVLPSVREAQARLLDKKLDLEYAGIAGIPDFVRLATEFAYGEGSSVIDRLAAVQALSGTGSLRIACVFLARTLGESTSIYIPNQTWGNHVNIAKDSGLSVERYRYYDDKTCGLDFDGMLEDLSGLEPGSVVLLHACAHNPTGVDPTPEQWDALLDIAKSRKLTTLFDSAYQGFATGDADADARAIRLFAEAGVPFLLCQSFAKNFGLYGERVGALSIVCDSPEHASTILSQLKVIIRPMYSNPPVSGARIVAEILSDPDLKAQWYSECQAMADRIAEARNALRTEVEKITDGQDWSHITSQIGMFCFTGLSPAQCDRMISEHHIYMTRNGRISMAGVTTKNAPYIASAIKEVIESTA